jgi:hypothetical protein
MAASPVGLGAVDDASVGGPELRTRSTFKGGSRARRPVSIDD